MAPARLHQQFIRLWQCCHGRSQQITLDRLSALLGCSRRYMRSLLNAMQRQGWLSWQAQAGRGKQSWLVFHYGGISSQQQQMDDLLNRDELRLLQQQLGDSQFAQLLRNNSGYRRLPPQLPYLPVTAQPYLSSSPPSQQHTCQPQLWLRLLSPRRLENLLPCHAQLSSVQSASTQLPNTQLSNTQLSNTQSANTQSANAQHPLERHVARQLFSGLLRLNPHNGQPQPDVAHHWQQLSPLHWRFHLRAEIRFHQGDLLTEQDVIHSLERLRQQPFAAHLQQINSSAPLTVDIYLQQPDRWLPWLLSSDWALILPKNWQAIADFSRLPAGSGPFQLLRHNSQAVGLQAFNDYFGYRPLTDRISIWLCTDNVAQQCPAKPLTAEQLPASPLASPRIEIENRQPAAAIPAHALCPWQLAASLLVLDQRQPAGSDPQYTDWLRQILTPAALLARLPPQQQSYLQIAWQLLPDAAAPASTMPASKPPTLHRLRLAYDEDNADFALISQQLRALLATYQISLQCLPLRFADIYHGRQTADLWLYELYLTAPLEFSLFFELWQLPLLRHALPVDWSADGKRWQTAELTAAPFASKDLANKALINKSLMNKSFAGSVFADNPFTAEQACATSFSLAQWCQQQRQILPLFHHRHFPPGWCDFASAWAE